MVEAATGLKSAQNSRYENGDATPELPALLLLVGHYEQPLDRILAGVDDAYDRIIAKRLPLDAQAIARGMVDAALLHATETFEAVTGAPEALAPTAAKSPGGRETGDGRSPSIRARTKRKPPK